jgi:hypothetical protein
VNNEQKIIAAIRQYGALDDDELCLRSGVQSRQQVNQICRRLERRGIVGRARGTSGKLVNQITVDEFPPVFTRESHRQPTPIPVDRREITLPSPPDRTLFLIPCSGAKSSGGGQARPNRTWLDDLPTELAFDLTKAREAVAERANLDTSLLLPAYQRYVGSFYKAAGNSLAEADRNGLHVLIISGGYELVSLREPIGRYEAVFNPAWWPPGLLEQVVLSYIEKHSLKHVRAFLAATTTYRRFVQKVQWGRADVKDAVLLAPAEVGGGAIVKTPRALGEAVRTALDNQLRNGWTSSDGILLEATSLISADY